MKFNIKQFIRQVFFWSFDAMRGCKIKKQYKEIKKIIESNDFDYINSKKNQSLNKLLNHAVDSVKYYKNHVNYKSILDFPIINKNIIRDNLEEFRSSGFRAKDCVIVSTSGSTGAPFRVLQNKEKKLRNLADNIYFYEKSGYKIGQKLFYIKIWPDKVKRKIFSSFWIKNIYPKSVFKLSDKDINNLIRTLKKDASSKSLIGYSSAFETICNYLDKINSEPIACNLRSIISMSETLKERVRDKMENYFGVIPMSRYSNNENGIIAQETIPNKFVINHASYYLEIFKINQDQIADYGELGRIVVTDLYNYAIPLIRYDTGDIGVANIDENKIPFLSSVEGRKLDLIYNTKGEIVPSHISYKLCNYGNYKQFQLIQHGQKEYKIKLNTDKKVDEFSMLKEYKSYFGEDAVISIEYVDEIPLISSGKRREVLNTCHVK